MTRRYGVGRLLCPRHGADEQVLQFPIGTSRGQSTSHLMAQGRERIGGRDGHAIAIVDVGMSNQIDIKHTRNSIGLSRV